MPKVSKQTASQVEASARWRAATQSSATSSSASRRSTKTATRPRSSRGCPTTAARRPTGATSSRAKLTFKYADHEEVYEAGDAYYAAPGHIPVISAGTESVEFSTAAEYERTMAVVGANLAAAIASSARRSVPERPSCAAGSSASRRSSAPRSSSKVWPARERRERDGIGARNAAQASQAAASVSGVARRRLGHSVSSSSGPSSPSPRNDGLPGTTRRRSAPAAPRLPPPAARRSAGAGRTGRARTRIRRGRRHGARGRAAGRVARARSGSRCGSPSRSRRETTPARPAARGASPPARDPRGGPSSSPTAATIPFPCPGRPRGPAPRPVCAGWAHGRKV